MKFLACKAGGSGGRASAFALDIPEGDGLGHEVAALDLQIAGQGPKHTNGAAGLQHLHVQIDAVAVDAAGRFTGGREAGCLPDQIRIQPEPRPHRGGGVSGGRGLQLLEAQAVIPDEISTGKVSYRLCAAGPSGWWGSKKAMPCLIG
jgi:hypothetical protein